jgi:hypothetical protein
MIVGGSCGLLQWARHRGETAAAKRGMDFEDWGEFVCDSLHAENIDALKRCCWARRCNWVCAGRRLSIVLPGSRANVRDQNHFVPHPGGGPMSHNLLPPTIARPSGRGKTTFAPGAAKWPARRSPGWPPTVKTLMLGFTELEIKE